MLRVMKNDLLASKSPSLSHRRVDVQTCPRKETSLIVPFGLSRTIG